MYIYNYIVYLHWVAIMMMRQYEEAMAITVTHRWQDPFGMHNNPLRFETTKCSKQRVEQASARTLFPKCVHKLGSPRFVPEAVS